jgi:hypothetical protein
MNLLVLDGPRDHRKGNNYLYRGTYRSHPTHCNELPDDSEINKLFFWFLETGGELGVVGDLSKALRLAELWNARLPASSQFEVMEVTIDDTNAQSGGQLVGFDLSSGFNNSLLATGLKHSADLSGLNKPVRVLCNLVSRHYGSLLNRNGLFQSIGDASMCLESMVALQELSPSLFEGGDLSDFHTVSLYKVIPPYWAGGCASPHPLGSG